MDKAAWRKKFEKQNNESSSSFSSSSLSSSSMSSSSADDLALFESVLKTFFAARTGVWGAFQPLSDEPPILSLLSSLSHIQWCFPRIEQDHLEFYKWSPDSRGEKHALNFVQPLKDPQYFCSKPELLGILVPGVAFDRQGFRLGRGRGFYDRYLHDYRGEKVGVTFSSRFVSESLPTESHDIPVDYLLTEEGVYRRARSHQGGHDLSSLERIA